jgi:SWIM zinc finger
VIERWHREQVLALAPDPASQKAAASVAKAAKWSGGGCDERAVWGECAGSGRSRYQACVDLSEPAFRCTCPSRKFPCKHALGLLILWSDGGQVAPESTEAPDWVQEWLTRRDTRARAEPAKGPAAGSRDPKTAARREDRVASGIAELDRWLCDQVGQGLAQAEHAPYQLWDEAARRLVDAQVTGVASRMKGLAAIPRQGAGWPRRLLEEYALLHLLARAYQRLAELPVPLRETVRARVGFSVRQEEVLAGPGIEDHWYVLGAIDEEGDGLRTRRVWLRGQKTGRPALVLSFGAPGRPLDASLVPGTFVLAELAYYPGAQALRAIVASRSTSGGSTHERPAHCTVAEMLGEYATALAADPWLDRWPVVLGDVRLARGWYLVDQAGDAVPLDTDSPWRLVAASGGRPLTVAGEWTPAGLRPLSAWTDENGVIVL